MEDGSNPIPPRRFRWYVHNPFLPFRGVDVCFNESYPTVTQWKAALRPTHREVGMWQFTLSLTAVRSGEGEFVILADRVVVEIWREGARLRAWEDDRGYSFDANNEHTYTTGTVAVEPGKCHLDIRIEIHYPNEVVSTGPGYQNLNRLSRDLEQLINRANYSDIRLISKHRERVVPAHTYMLDVRWDNFFTLHARQPSVETDISAWLLSDLLTFMYSGAGRIVDRNLNSGESYVKELFQVMSTYDLDHLYAFFFSEAPEQVRRTIFYSSSLVKDFPVRGVGGQEYSWKENPFHSIAVQLKVKFSESSRDHPSLSYSLFFSDSMVLYVRVIVTLRRENNPDKFLHQMDYTVGLGNRLVACPDASLGEWGDLEGRGRYRPSIRFSVSVSNGRKSVSISRESVAQELERWEDGTEVLSRHMRRLMLQRDERTMRVVCKSLRNPSGPRQIHRFHQGIFVSRITDRELVLGEQELPEISGTVNCNCSGRVFEFMTEYFYTGKCPLIPPEYFYEISEFATLCGHQELADTYDLYRRYPHLILPSGAYNQA